MAESPAHKFGQKVGNLLENIVEPVLRELCTELNLYLDRKGPRPGVRSGSKISWDDIYGNKHDLDFVIEKPLKPGIAGRPVAFVETAWRRYTKHSRNKAQEIQGAVLPIVEKYYQDKPFLGCVLAGEFTQNSLRQLESVGFQVLYFSYSDTIDAFASVGIDISFDESTEDAEYARCIRQIDALSSDKYEKLKKYLVNERKELFGTFITNLRRSLERVIIKLIVSPLFGPKHEFEDIAGALQFCAEFDEIFENGDFRGYDVECRFSNGDSISARFSDKVSLKGFLVYLGSSV